MNNSLKVEIELDILVAQFENLKVYSEIAKREAFGPNSLVYECKGGVL